MSLMWFLVIVRAPGRGGWWGAVRNSSNHSHREIKRLRVVKLSFFYLPVQNENNVGRIRIITLTSMTSYPRDPAQTHFHNNFKFHGQFLTFNLEVLINFVRTSELRQLTLTRPLRRKLRMRWLFDLSKVKESSFFLNRTSLTPPSDFCCASFRKYQFKSFQLSFYSGFNIKIMFWVRWF